MTDIEKEIAVEYRAHRVKITKEREPGMYEFDIYDMYPRDIPVARGVYRTKENKEAFYKKIGFNNGRI